MTQPRDRRRCSRVVVLNKQFFFNNFLCFSHLQSSFCMFGPSKEPDGVFINSASNSVWVEGRLLNGTCGTGGDCEVSECTINVL